MASGCALRVITIDSLSLTRDFPGRTQHVPPSAVPALCTPSLSASSSYSATSCQAIKIDRSRRREVDAIVSADALDLCPAECVREIKTEKELDFVIEFGKEHGVLIVVDFFRTACPSCKYVEKGYLKLCRLEGELEEPVLFFKHNVMDDTEELSDIAERYRIKSVPLFHFYKDGELVEAFHTRDKERLLDTMNRLTHSDLVISEKH